MKNGQKEKILDETQISHCVSSHLIPLMTFLMNVVSRLMLRIPLNHSFLLIPHK